LRSVSLKKVLCREDQSIAPWEHAGVSLFGDSPIFDLDFRTGLASPQKARIKDGDVGVKNTFQKSNLKKKFFFFFPLSSGCPFNEGIKTLPLLVSC